MTLPAGTRVEIVASAELPREIVVPCNPSPANFSFTSASSEIFTPSGGAPIAQAGWALPLATTSITTLPGVAGPGAAVLELDGRSFVAPNHLFNR